MNPNPPTNTADAPRREGLWLGLILFFAFGLRLIGITQPIVENYVGRQIPTAMVARNLDQNSGFLNPILDVGPFPNRFLVEPPIFGAVVVGLKRGTGLPLESAGRMVSACGVVLAGWGLFGLARRREGFGVALVAVAIFAVEPVTIRYGRAFQPDALMLGCVVAAMRLLDQGTRGRVAVGWGLLAVGLALKITTAYVLLPIGWFILKGSMRERVQMLVGALLPSTLWYLYVMWIFRGQNPNGSRAALDNQAIWLSMLIPAAWARWETYQNVARFLLVRAFTPLGPPLACWGLVVGRPRCDRLWIVWGLSALSTMAALAAKLHHEYYWLSIAPVMAVGMARGLVVIGRARPWLGASIGAVLLALSATFSASTWTTPTEWRSLRAAAAEVRARVPRDAWVVAPEALLFASDRRGCRLELTNSAARRAAGEWPGANPVKSPLDLVAFYQSRGAQYFADVCPDDATSARKALHAAIASRYNVVVNRPGIFLARLTKPDP